uniref:Uncharacterized protein n=1 Tax=Mycena chlorophos TaxID=658473 RepID=A0ABQ0LL69_MYCCL|nr:predicted protein [Mycena chlorophos]
MGRTAHYLTQEAKATAKAHQKAAWEKTSGYVKFFQPFIWVEDICSGQYTRKQQREARSRRHTTATRIPRLPPLPSNLYTWLKCPESPDYTKRSAFRKALHDDYDETPIAHWLEDPPFEVPDQCQSTCVGPAYKAETQRLIYAVHARRMRAVQARETARRQLEVRLTPFYAMEAWRNQAQLLLLRWNDCLGGLDHYDAKAQPRERAMWLIHMHWLATELDRLYHLKFLKLH